MSTTTTGYGTWCNTVSPFSTSPESDLNDLIGGGDQKWRELLTTSGAYERIVADYRQAINAALPPDVALCGDQFIGPAYPEPGEWDGYPTDNCGSLDIKACVTSVDLQEIVERHDPDA